MLSQAEAAETAPTASNRPGAAAGSLASVGNAEAIAANTSGTSAGRKLLESYLSAATLHRMQQRRLLQQTAGSLSPQCRDLVLLAEPTDAFAQYQTSLSATAVSSQVENLERSLGLSAGTLTSRNRGGLTLTGWSAVFGILAILAVTAAGAIFAYRRYKGLDKHAGYTMVKKAKSKQVELNGN